MDCCQAVTKKAFAEYKVALELQLTYLVGGRLILRHSFRYLAQLDVSLQRSGAPVDKHSPKSKFWVQA